MYTTQKIKFSIKDFFSKCYQIRSFPRIRSHLLKKYLMENFIFCAVVRISSVIFFKLKYVYVSSQEIKLEVISLCNEMISFKEFCFIMEDSSLL